MAFRMGLRRYFQHWKETESAFDDGSLNAIQELCSKASKTLLQLPPALSRLVWKFWPDGFEIGFIESLCKHLWYDFLFELGWQVSPFDPLNDHLSIPRITWKGSFAKASLPSGPLIPRLTDSRYTAVELQAGRPLEISSLHFKTIAHTEGYPWQMYSHLPNIATQSVHAIDWLVSLFDANTSNGKKKLSVWERSSPLQTFVRILQLVEEKMETDSNGSAAAHDAISKIPDGKSEVTPLEPDVEFDLSKEWGHLHEYLWQQGIRMRKSGKPEFLNAFDGYCNAYRGKVHPLSRERLRMPCKTSGTYDDKEYRSIRRTFDLATRPSVDDAATQVTD